MFFAATFALRARDNFGNTLVADSLLKKWTIVTSDMNETDNKTNIKK